MAKVSVSRTESGFRIDLEEADATASFELSPDEAQHIGFLVAASRIPSESSARDRLLEVAFLSVDQPLFEAARDDTGRIALTLTAKGLRPMIVQMGPEYAEALIVEIARALGLTTYEQN